MRNLNLRTAGGPARYLRLAALLLLTPVLLAGCGRTALEYVNDAQSASTPAERESLLTRALEKDPDMKIARLQRAQVYVLQKKFDLAMADYDVLRKATLVPDELAVIVYWRGRAFEAAEKFPEAAESYSDAIRCDRNFVNPYLARADVWFKLRKYSDAVEDYSTMLERDIASQGDPSQERRIEWRLRRGVAHFCTGELRYAAEDFKAAYDSTKLPSRESFALLNLYFTVCKTGDKKKADEALNTYASDKLAEYGPGRRDTPWNFTALWFVAGLLSEQQFLEGAKHTNKEAEAARLAAAHYYIGAKLLAIADLNAARAAFEKCVQCKNLDSLEFHMATAELERLATGGKSANDYVALARQAPSNDKKIEFYSEALKIDPASTDARLNRALLYSLTGKHDLAIDDYSRVLEIYKRPANLAVAFRYRGQTYAQKGDHLAAIKDYEAAVKADPDLWEARAGLAESLCAIRKYPDAATVYSALMQVLAARALRPRWLLERGFAAACAADWKTTTQDFETVLKNTPDLPLIQTHLYFIRCRFGDRADATRQFTAFAEKLKAPGWESSVAWFAAERLPDGLTGLLKASEHSDKEIAALRTSRAYYYAGALALARSRPDEAAAGLERCVALGKTLSRESWEYRMALAELARKASWR